MKRRPEVILEYILAGASFESGGAIYGMDEEDHLLMQFQRGSGEKLWLVVDVSLKGFIDLVEEMTDEEYLNVIAGKAILAHNGK